MAQVSITIPRPGHKYIATPADLYVTAEYSYSSYEEADQIEYDSIKDGLGFDWLPIVNDAFLSYVDSQVKRYISEL